MHRPCIVGIFSRGVRQGVMMRMADIMVCLNFSYVRNASEYERKGSGCAPRRDWSFEEL